jgi:outer membrane lipoprotein-sorting protein
MKSLTLLAVGLLAAGLVPAALGQDKDAEKFYRGMEKKLLAAKSFEVAFDYEVNKRKARGELLLAPENKVRLKVAGHFEDQRKAAFEMISDGKKLKAQGVKLFIASNGQPGAELGGMTEADTPKNFQKVLTGVSSRGGVWYMVFGMPYLLAAEGNLDMEGDRSRMQAYDFKLGEPEKVGDKDARVIRYRFGDGSSGRDNADITLWIDAKTELPLKRVFSMPNGPRVVETYRYNLDPKIDARAFELPK